MNNLNKTNRQRKEKPKQTGNVPVNYYKLKFNLIEFKTTNKTVC